ncbi:MAG: GHMP kinase [Pseudomonadota bacterium]
MILSKTPLRVSFFGGGSDYREYFEHLPGCVIGTTINQYIYIAGVHSYNFDGIKYWISYSLNEAVCNVDDISHPVVREVLKWMDLKEGLSLSVISNLPSRTGLGSSSSFAVGLINLLSKFKSLSLTKFDLAKRAIFVEQELLQENVGIQDQMHASFGGFNKFSFQGKDDFYIEPIKLSFENMDLLNQSMYLVSTDIARYASEAVADQTAKIKARKLDRQIESMVALAHESQSIFESQNNSQMIKILGEMLNQNWQIKRQLSDKITNSVIDELYDTMRATAPVGGKLCGAGAGGFLLMLIAREHKKAIEKAIAPRKLLPIAIEPNGSTLFEGI